ncbi:DsbA family protein [Demequina lutea]|uniref:Protein-disulfide isomerase n=1 Tax=Demequina lutea TaxID=431489 RepID=A0A7Y9Z833_9MICO|nr:DsbA family protein [Demequina lutea]NYI40552.1 protein-disulfide isomerase [Demequina lutea]
MASKTPQSGNTPQSDKVAVAKKKAQSQVHAQQRRALVVWIVIGVVVVGLFAALIAYIVRQGNVSSVATTPGQLNPAIATTNGGFGVGASGVVGGKDLSTSHVRLDIYFDYMCPICGEFEQYRGAEVDALRKAGTADVYYHPISILDGSSSGTQYSTRAASAGALIAQDAPDKFLAFTTAMFVNQPKENSTGLTEAQIQAIATAAGVPADVVAKIPALAYTSWVRSATEKASVDGVAGTPTLALNGVIQDPSKNKDDINWSVAGSITTAINKAAGK